MSRFILCLTLSVMVMLGVLSQNKTCYSETSAKRELLAEHETLSVFEGIHYRKCMGLTALCPDKCGDSGEFAEFKVIQYTRYKQYGKYGGKQQKYRVQISDFNRKPKGDLNIAKKVKSLKKGDKVLLWWRHDYVTKDRVSSPERQIVRLEKIHAEFEN